MSVLYRNLKKINLDSIDIIAILQTKTIMKIECIEKPNKGYVCRNITVGKTYDVIRVDGNDYYLTDDNKEDYYYQISHFKEIKQLNK